MRCQNIKRKHSVGGPECKKIKLDTPKRTYAIVDVEIEDDVSAKRNKQLLKKRFQDQSKSLMF